MAEIDSLDARRRTRQETPEARLDYLLQALRQAGLTEFATRTEAQRQTQRTPVAELVNRCEEYAAVAGLKYVFRPRDTH